MKKIMLVAVMAGAFAFTSCSSDDDGGSGSASDCITCSMSMEGMEVSNEYCDNGDGTYTVDGVETELPEGTTFDQIIQGFEMVGMDCN